MAMLPRRDFTLAKGVYLGLLSGAALSLLFLFVSLGSPPLGFSMTVFFDAVAIFISLNRGRVGAASSTLLVGFARGASLTLTACALFIAIASAG